MNDEYNDILSTLHSNINKIILLYNDEKQRNIELSNEVKKLNDELNIFKEKNETLTKQYDNLKLAKTLAEIEGNENDAKIKLNKIIREINNCIALLNQ